MEKARAFFMRTVSSFGNTGALKKYNSWSYTVNDSRYKCSQSVARVLSKIEGLCEVVEQLRTIQLENRDFKQIFEAYDGPNTIFYVDPPYLKSTRTGNIDYKHELSKADHLLLCKILNGLHGQYLLSGYENELYEQKLKYTDRKTLLGCKTNSLKRTTEVLWANYNLTNSQISLF